MGSIAPTSNDRLARGAIEIFPDTIENSVHERAGLGAAESFRELALQKRGDAIIAVGVILKGETNHAENLSRSVTDALQRIAVTHGIPVINAVLTFDDEDQARARCLENKINRGTEAARAAVEIANVISKLRSR